MASFGIDTVLELLSSIVLWNERVVVTIATPFLGNDWNVRLTSHRESDKRHVKVIKYKKYNS